MNEYRNKIDNSYESSSGSASNSVGENNMMHNSINFDANEGLAALILPSNEVLGCETYNTSAEEGIFPNITTNCTVEAPSYEPEYDYYNQYSTQPLVYSWMPIVPGFSEDGTHNLHNFQHIEKRIPQPLDISGNDGNSSIVSDQNKRYERCLVLNKSDEKKNYILNNSSGINFNHQLDDSCNAIDLSISCHNETNNSNLDLSFNGKILELTTSSTFMNEYATKGEEEDKDNDHAIVEQIFDIKQLDTPKETISKQVEDDSKEDSDTERLRNESFEFLKKEDSSKMLYLNEKSPEIDKSNLQEDNLNDEQQIDSASLEKSNEIKSIEKKFVVGSTSINSDDEYDRKKDEFEVNFSSKSLLCQHKNIESKEKDSGDSENLISSNSSKKLDLFLLTRIKRALGDKPPPASISELPLSLSEMLTMYNANIKLKKESFKVIDNTCAFRPTHPTSDVPYYEWPEAMYINGLGLMYNRNEECEEIELLTLKYSEKFIKAETSSSYNHKISPTSAKKRTERLKLITQSPGSRLSHLANRRKVFSSAHLKSSSSSQSLNKSYSGNGQMLIDKAKLYQKKKRMSAKKKTPGRKGTPNKGATPGKKKTPPSSKRQAKILSVYKPGTSTAAATSKRALFTSPIFPKISVQPSTSRDLPKRMTLLPKRSLFSPVQKRKRSPSPDIENRFGKTRRLASPTRLPISKSLSISAVSMSIASSAPGSLDEHYKKTLYYRSQPELNQSTDDSKIILGFRKPLSDTEKKKLLWAASSALQSKKINREHEKFKDYMATLCKLVKKIFAEFYNPQKSMSSQMTKFANLMVFYVIQGRSFEDIYATTKSRLEAQNPTKISGYIAKEDFEKNRFIRQRSSLVLLSDSTLNFSGSLEALSSDISDSDTSLNRSTSKNNISGVLRENINCHNSGKKFAASESNLSKLKTTTPSNILKAKRQISF